MVTPVSPDQNQNSRAGLSRREALASGLALSAALAAAGLGLNRAQAFADTASGSADADSGSSKSHSTESSSSGSSDSLSGSSSNGALLDWDTIKKEAAALVTRNSDGLAVVSHKYGETTVPRNPERIVCLKLEDLMLALDIPMVAARDFDEFYLHDEIQALGIDTIAVDEVANTINLEQVLAAKPDLIVVRDSFEQSIYDELSKIAPVIAFHLQDAEISLLALGMALNQEGKAYERLRQYQSTLYAAREQLVPVHGQPVALVRVLKKEIRLYSYSKSDFSSFLYAYLDLTPDPMVVEYDEKDSPAISLEVLPDLTAEHIFLVPGYGSSVSENDQAAKAYYAQIKEDPLWQSVKAVQEGHVYEVDSRTWLTHGIIAVERRTASVLEHLV